MIGKHLGPYEIIEEIGKGGMATVYRARQPSMERDVAIKVIHGSTTGDPAAIQRFQREARLVARLEHPHILPVYDFDGTHDPPYIVMRYLDSGTLEEVLAQGQLPLDEITFLMRQVCSALDYAHRQGIIHRDIKPSNIMIDREGNAFVTDFGIARIAVEPVSLQLTVKGAIIGTPDYMSPEQARGLADVDQRSDIYALGVMVFQMLTGGLPYSAETPVGVLMQHIQEPVPAVRERNPLLPAQMDDFVRRAMAKNREERYQTAAEFSAALVGMLDGSVSASPNWLREAAGTAVIRRSNARDGEERAKTTPAEQYKQIVALYANAAEYDQIIEESNGSEAARRAMGALWSAFDRVITEAGGSVFARSDNDLLACWGADAARENDAERAIRAALAMQAGLRLLGAAFLDGEDELLPLNIGIHSGVALIKPGEKEGTTTASGAAISLANRLMQAANGTILITHDTYRQVRGVFAVQPHLPLRMRGRAEGVETYSVTAAKPRAFRINSRGVEGVETRMIGREAELKHLQNAFLNAMEDGETQVVTISGEAGTGKSRLLNEFEEWSELRPEVFFIFRGRATPELRERPYALLRDVITFRFEILEDDPPPVVAEKLERGVVGLISENDRAAGRMAHLIGHLCGFDVSESPHIKPLLGDPGLLAEKARTAFVRLFTTLAQERYVVIALEDLHHADDASLELLSELFAVDNALHLLVICLARPALFAHHPGWGSGQAFHTRLDLGPLDKRESRDLVAEILQKVDDVPRGLRDLLVERAEGNPYYLEELVKMLIDDHVIVRESDERWLVEESRLGALNVPPTLSGLLEARLDTLLYPEKLTLQRASVIGRIFYDQALQAIDAADRAEHGSSAHVTNLAGVLANLVKREFIRKREPSALAGSAEYIFTQAMLRDTIYNRLLERQLRVYHHAVADWLAGLERAEEYLPLIAEHYERAGLLEDASCAFHAAGDQASRRGLMRKAEELYRRALERLPEDSDRAIRLELLLDLGAAANDRGELPAAQPLLEQAQALAEAAGDPAMQAKVRYQLSLLETTRGDYPAALRCLAEAQPLARQSADRDILAHVLLGLADTHFRAGNLVEARAAAEEGITLARSLGDDVLKVWLQNRLGTIDAQEGLYESARKQFERALEHIQRIGYQRIEVPLLSNLGNVAIMQQDWKKAVTFLEAATKSARENGDLLGFVVAACNLATCLLRIDAAQKAPALLHEALLAAQQMHSMAWMVSTVAIAGEYKLATGDISGGLALMGMAQAHPAVGSDGQADIKAALVYYKEKQGLTEAQIQAGLEAGRALDPEAAVKEMLEEWDADKHG